MKTVIYARYSAGANQTEQSIEGQLRVCYEYAQKHELTVVDTYIDRAISGTTDEREQFQQMLKDSDKRLFEAVIVYKMDRFSRNRYDSAVYKARLKKNGVKIHYATEAIPDGPEGIILESLLEGMAEYYSEELSQKIRRGMKESAHKCKSLGGPPPLGYAFTPEKTFVLDEKLAPVIQKIFAWYDDGMPVVRICRELNEMGLKTSHGSIFNKNSLRNILKNEKYIGVYEANGVRVEGGVPAIVEVEVFGRVQVRIEANRRAPARGKADVKYMLTGKLYCGKCGQGMLGVSGTSKTGTKHYYYSCGNRKHRKTCDKKDVRKSWLEELVVSETARHVLQPERIDVIAKRCVEMYAREVAQNNDLTYLNKQLADTNKAISNLMAAIEQGIVMKTTKARLAELEQAQEKLEFEIGLAKVKQPALTERQVKYMLNQFQRETDEPLEEYNEHIIDCFVSSVYLYDDKLIVTYNLTNEKSELESSDLALLYSADTSGKYESSCSYLGGGGGGEENRTPVQRYCHIGFSERSLCF